MRLCGELRRGIQPWGLFKGGGGVLAGGKEKGSRNEQELVPAFCTSGKRGTRADAVNMRLSTGTGVGSKGR